MEHTVPESGEVVIFEEEDADEYDPDVKDPDAVEIEPEESDDEFEYGCPYCSATISEDATECSHCGNRFEEKPYNSTPGYDSLDVEPLSSGYSETGSYDPRPEYIKRHRIETASPNMEGPASDYNEYSNSFKPKDKIRLCEMCGNKLSYVKSYKRWYCFTCKRYEGTLSSSPDLVPPAPEPPITNSGDPSPILSSATPTKRASGSPEGFRELYTPRPDMESTAPVKPRRNPSAVRPEPAYRKPYQNRKKPLKNYPVYDD
jgi:ribosomal protein L37AE/L43A